MVGKVVVEVLGSVPPCPKCRKTYETIAEVVRELGAEGRVEVVKVDAKSPEVASKYGVVLVPSVAVNGVVRISGRVPSKEEVTRILEEALK